MIRFLLAYLAVMCLGTALWGQIPSSITYQGRPGPSPSRADCNNSAGTILGFSPRNSQTNDLTRDTLYLCYGDTIFVDHADDENLTGDPNLATPGGIAYAFYAQPPTVEGPTLADIQADPSLLTPPPPSGNGIWVYKGPSSSGDALFFNGGQLQTQFNGGAPLLLWFAPITYDNVDPVTGAPSYESEPGGPTGPCVDVSIDEAFAVVYLNAITPSEINTSTGCQGSFRIRGGLPEFMESTYDISITLAGNPQIRGTVLNGSANNNKVVQFAVPQPGNYLITVEDGKSCPAAFPVSMGACEAVTFRLPLRNAQPGAEICVPFTVENFVNLSGIQLDVSWDASILSFVEVRNINANVPSLSAGSFGLPGVGSTPNNVLTLSWFSPTAASLGDGEAMFEICFNVLGALGTSSPLDIGGLTNEVEVVDGNSQPKGYILDDGRVNVSSDPFFFSMRQDSLSCASNNDGAIIFSVDQGMPPYQITVVGPNNATFPQLIISTQRGTDTLSNLEPGKYSVTITDSGGNTISNRVIEVLSPPKVGVEMIFTSPTCSDLSDGTVTVNIEVDAVPVPNPGSDYTFAWNVPAGNTSTLINQPAGFYSVVVTDPWGCSTTASGTMQPPAPLRITSQNTNITDASCSGAEDGAITVLATGGTQGANGYTYTWDNGAGTQQGTQVTLTDLLPGQYKVTVTDANSCTYIDSFVVSAVKTLVINGQVTDVVCNGDSTGQIFVSGATQGAPADEPYTFTWSGTGPNAPQNTPTTSQLTGLPAGTYALTMTDASTAGCQVIDTFTVAEPEPLVVEVLELINETCAVGNDGRITLGVTGGQAPYTYTWSHDSLGVLMDSIATGLSADTSYAVTVTDALGCEQVFEYDILAPTPPQITALADAFVSCPNSTDGQLSVTAVPGGAAIASYQWSTGATGTSISGLAPGTYTITITAQDACVTIDTALVLSPGPVVLDSTDLQLPSCPGGSDGQIALFVTGGTAPYSYTWSTNPGQATTLNPLPGLSAGTYNVTITDANNCTPLVQTIILPDPPAITASFSNVQDASCPDDVACDGQATLTAQYADGSAGNFTITWASGQTDIDVVASTAVQLCRGTQQVTVSDGNCSQTFTVEIGSPDSIQIQAQITRVSCHGDENGAINLNPTGGTAPYSYLWAETGETTASIADLPAGVYAVAITDANGCVVEEQLEVTQPDPLVAELDSQSTNSVTCNGDQDGVFAVFVNTSNTNPLPPDAYTWSNNVAPATSNIADNLPAGTYSVTVTDVKGCMATLEHTISEPLPIDFTIAPIQEPACFGESTVIVIDTAFGGAGTSFAEFVFEINNDGFKIPVTQPGRIFAGENIVTVEDPNGCTASDTVLINQPPQITINLPETYVIELGDSLTQLTPIINPPGDQYSYKWTPIDYLSSDTVRTPFIYPFESREYTLVVTNLNGCTANAVTFVEVDANRNIFVPNAFSPDGDGRNDDFRVFACRGVTAVNFVRIFDRWGNMIYQADNLAPNCLDGIRLWDGLWNDRIVNPGVFVYMVEVEFLDGVTLMYRGDVTVVH